MTGKDPGSPVASTSPCVRNCCLDDDDVCLGCGRAIAEITGWNTSSPDERREILARAGERMERRRRQDAR